MAQLLDHRGNPVKRSDLTRPLEDRSRVGSVRSPLTGYPGDGLDPHKLGVILREADRGDPVRYLELAETIEERDPHYTGVLGTRRRSVSQIQITVTEAEGVLGADRHAKMVRDWLKRDVLSLELFDILDAIGKGFSFTHIGWDFSSGQLYPEKLELWDPRWFRFDRRDLRTPLMLDENGAEVPLPPWRFIQAEMRAKSGLPLRSGIARIAVWGWMFKMFTLRDWAIFTQTYGQPVRVGKWHRGASEDDKDTLFRAVADIAGDCAAIIPEEMSIEFIQTPNLGAASDLYRSRADWLDQQISKAILGQTATTDAIAGGHAVGQEHREVQEDIERADAVTLAAILNRDLIRPWINLEFGPQRAYPSLVIARPEQEDLTQLATALGQLVPLGFEVDQEEVRSKFGLKKPENGAQILSVGGVAAYAGQASGRVSPLKGVSGVLKGGGDQSGVVAPQSASRPSAGDFSGGADLAAMSDQLQEELAPHIADMIDQVEAMLDVATSLEELREMIQAAFPAIDATKLASSLAIGLAVADAAGQVEVLEDDG